MKVTRRGFFFRCVQFWKKKVATVVVGQCHKLSGDVARQIRNPRLLRRYCYDFFVDCVTFTMRWTLIHLIFNWIPHEMLPHDIIAFFLLSAHDERTMNGYDFLKFYHTITCTHRDAITFDPFFLFFRKESANFIERLVGQIAWEL